MVKYHLVSITNADGTFTEKSMTTNELKKLSNKPIGRPRRIGVMHPDAIKSWRKANGYSREALARLIGVTANTVYNWERGKTNPPFGLETILSGTNFNPTPVAEPPKSNTFDPFTATPPERILKKYSQDT